MIKLHIDCNYNHHLAKGDIDETDAIWPIMTLANHDEGVGFAAGTDIIFYPEDGNRRIKVSYELDVDRLMLFPRGISNIKKLPKDVKSLQYVFTPEQPFSNSFSRIWRYVTAMDGARAIGTSKKWRREFSTGGFVCAEKVHAFQRALPSD